jgi:hypothetical protein
MQKAIYSFLVLLTCSGLQSQPASQFGSAEKYLIKEAMNIAAEYGEKTWSGISKVPFVVILVTDSFEFLVNHPYPSADFKLLGEDGILKTKVLYRKAQFDKHLLATFPAVNGVNCIVVGTPQNTGKRPVEWIATLLHEHFHQYEYTYPDYYSAVDSLNLSGGDQTGMWMLNYDFPYDSSAVNEQYIKYISALSKAVSAINTKTFTSSFKEYEAARKNFRQVLTPNDYRYFSFQLWQEGIARYTEYKFLEQLENYKVAKGTDQLCDIRFKDYKLKFYASQIEQLNKLQLNKDKRVCFYAIGFAEGLLLDKVNPKWRESFLTDKFYLENYFQKLKSTQK